MFLLDTNACIKALNRTSQPLVDRLGQSSPTEIRLCSIVKAELMYGARHSAHVANNLRILDQFFAPFISIPFDDTCSDCYGLIRADLASRGQMIGPNDLMIAAVAKAHDLTLVTHNIREFVRILGLRVEDWESDNLTTPIR